MSGGTLGRQRSIRFDDKRKVHRYQSYESIPSLPTRPVATSDQSGAEDESDLEAQYAQHSHIRRQYPRRPRRLFATSSQSGLLHESDGCIRTDGQILGSALVFAVFVLLLMVAYWDIFGV